MEVHFIKEVEGDDMFWGRYQCYISVGGERILAKYVCKEFIFGPPTHWLFFSSGHQDNSPNPLNMRNGKEERVLTGDEIEQAPGPKALILKYAKKIAGFNRYAWKQYQEQELEGDS